MLTLFFINMDIFFLLICLLNSKSNLSSFNHILRETLFLSPKEGRADLCVVGFVSGVAKLNQPIGLTREEGSSEQSSPCSQRLRRKITA